MLISADQALETVLKNVATLGIERISIREALGRVLAEEVRSSRDIPGFNNSAMDGYAIRAADTAGASPQNPVTLRVLETIAAGNTPTTEVRPACASRIMTGAPIPPGADAVVPVEQTRVGEGTVEILAPAAAGSCVRLRGEDLRRDEPAMAPGRNLEPSDIGMLASLSRPMVYVYRRPRVALVATGDELVDADQVPTGAQVVNSNGYALAAGVLEAGGEPSMLRIARDRVEEIRERLKEASGFDLILTTGGVSVGQFDHVKHVLDELGMQRLFHGVAQKPGRPLAFGLMGGRPVFGLPGNPVSTVVCFYLYVRPALLRMGGRSALSLPRITARCATDIRTANNLTEFVRVRLERRDGEFYATPTGAQGSGILSSLTRADGLLIGPARANVMKAGSQATVLLLGDVADSTPGFEERLRLQAN